jgi:SSS family solute:Na+ symporter
MKDFYVPWVKPSERHQIVALRIVSVIIGFLPVPFALYVPSLLKTVFFARALRGSLSVIVLMMFYAPRFGGKNVAAGGLIMTVLCTTAWFVLHNPFGIDNIYVAVVVPLLWMLGSRLFCHAEDGPNHVPLVAKRSAVE